MSFRRTRALLVWAVCAALCAAVSVRIWYVNAPLGKLSSQRAGMGDWIQLDEPPVRARVTDASLLTYGEVKNAIPGYANEMVDAGTAGDVRILIVGIALDNTGSEEVRNPLLSFSAQSGAWVNGVDLELFSRLNGNAVAVSPLAVGACSSYRVPFALYDVNFGSQRAWDAVRLRPFELVLRLFPKKHVIALDLAER